MKKIKEAAGCLKETRGYWKVKVEAMARKLWRICFRRGYGPL
jgi:hypothetical protein